MTVKKAASPAEQVKFQISPPKFQQIELELTGTEPLVIQRFWKKGELMEGMEKGNQKKKGEKRKPRDFERDYIESLHTSPEGWHGIHAGAFRCALISACRLVGFKMTLAKLGVFVLSDGRDQDGVPIIRIHGKPKRFDAVTRNANGGMDVRSRPMFDDWSVNLRVRYDSEMFSAEDIVNLLMRVGMQVGVGEGRPDSKMSAGQGWGLFSVETGIKKQRKAS